MSFTRPKTTTDVHQNMPDNPSLEGYTAAQLKTAFDAPATGLKGDINGLETELEASTAAASIGAAPIASGDASQGNVQAKLEKIYQDIQDIALGDIPDGTITENKIESTFASAIAKKDGTLQTNLNADRLGGQASSNYALKNGTLQTNLNSEKLGGSTKAQIINQITTRQSEADSSFTSARITTTEVIETKTIQTNSRWLLVKAEALLNGGASSRDDIKFGLFDCRNNKFLLTFAANTTNFQISTKYQNLNSVSDASQGYLYLYFQNFSYSSGTLQFQIGGKLSSSSETGVYNAKITIFKLDGLLP